ncbi:MAG: hypothetical protein A3F84_04270 [Candidatus Handelsmanbacteria bacterium RIFCSPLOWO2_12_FULL_64_10]|uniref:TfoX N-terminal domain-containing protein n=1 Tax=Handelsmanbacteria sp. (strain RIFCSPLOWO2_12_FULL_64_10) TaxID=1817868 RepID=A0A1F6D343_HANXR|nr:MAG: hypothetical protein A3F84_04270 [Candidatus Handelsmanbacteria bacterium RIFCSPLOWO2_12_FULL_64_10]
MGPGSLRKGTQVGDQQPPDELFWRVAQTLLKEPSVSRSTMMGFPCLRFEGRFFASVEQRTGDLIVKLPAVRILSLIRKGTGQPFAPNGRVFREWVNLPIHDEQQWAALLREAMEFAAGG